MLRRKNHWRRWLGLKGELWYYRDAATRTADRPHSLSIVLTALSPLLAVVAAIISYVALQTNQRGLEVGQRAYLVVADPVLQLQRVGSDEGIVVIDLKLTVKNLGNTPATIDSFSLQLDVPDSWRRPSNLRETPIMSVLNEVTGKADALWTYHRRFMLEDQAIKTFDQRPRIGISGTLHYTDVFRKRQELKWCWKEAWVKDESGEYVGVPAGSLTTCSSPAK